jgi:hypothetical protein
VEICVSPPVDEEGYTTDGVSNFTIGTRRLRKWDKDYRFILENNDPFDGITGMNHMGDGAYFSGKLYVPIETWNQCPNVENQSFAVFDANTLKRLEVHNVVAFQNEVSGMAIAPNEGPHGLIYSTSFCDNEHIYMYDLPTFAPVGSIELSPRLSSMQGVAYRSGKLYISAGVAKAVFQVSLTGKVLGKLYSDLDALEVEGLDFSQDEIRWLVITNGVPNVHYIRYFQ